MTTQERIDAGSEQTVFEWFADAHPHECYAAYPERFWQHFHMRCPDVSRADMERILRETEEE